MTSRGPGPAPPRSAGRCPRSLPAAVGPVCPEPLEEQPHRGRLPSERPGCGWSGGPRCPRRCPMAKPPEFSGSRETTGENPRGRKAVSEGGGEASGTYLGGGPRGGGPGSVRGRCGSGDRTLRVRHPEARAAARIPPGRPPRRPWGVPRSARSCGCWDGAFPLPAFLCQPFARAGSAPPALRAQRTNALLQKK